MDIKDLVTLSDDKEYIVVSKVVYESKTYYYLLENIDYSNVKFLVENGEELKSVKDKELILKLLPLFIQATNETITEEEMEIINQYVEESKPE